MVYSLYVAWIESQRDHNVYISPTNLEFIDEKCMALC